MSWWETDGWRAWPPLPREVAAARDGDGDALHRILAAGMPKLVAFFRGLGLRIHDAEDLAADTGEALVRHLGKLRNPATFETWFWRVARNKFHDYLRRKQLPQETAIPVPEAAPEDHLVLADDHQAVREAFLQLKPRDREVLWMRDVVGLDYQEIAGRLRLKEGAVRVAVMRARQRLEEGLLADERRER